MGQLAAGIAHEINTPAQFISDNLHFLSEAFTDLETLRSEYRETIDLLVVQANAQELEEKISAAEETADLEFLREHIPSGLKMAIDGILQIASIVGAMKEFAHPDRGKMAPADINHAIQATLTVTRNETKHVAVIETDLGDLPPVSCRIGEMNQVFLNLVVNAAHAIGDLVKGTEAKGIIRIRTRVERPWVRIDIEDTGCGIPVEIRERVFEPFFTTKEVGRGTGQGLPIARSIVEGKHGGTLTFTSEVGKGTTFTVRIPLERTGMT